MNDFPNNRTHRPEIAWVFFALEAKPTSMRRALAERLGEKAPVVIVDQPLSVLRNRRLSPLNTRVNRLPGLENSWHYFPLHFPVGFPGVGKISRVLNRHLLKYDLDRLLPKGTKRMICFDSSRQENFVGRLGEDFRIYLVVDDLTVTLSGEAINGEVEAESRLLSKVDLTICVSEVLADRLRKRSVSTRRFIQVLPNGFDERIFCPDREFPEPEALQGIPSPRVLVTGHVSERIDWKGIGESLKLRPEWTWLFLGPAEREMQARIQAVLGKHGFYHPALSVKDIPAWIHHSEVCAVPYRLNAFTTASHPLKAMEYLAMGAPVLSTRVASLRRYDGTLEWAEEGDGKSYAGALDRLQKQGKESRFVSLRRGAVKEESIGVRAEQFKKMVETYL